MLWWGRMRKGPVNQAASSARTLDATSGASDEAAAVGGDDQDLGVVPKVSAGPEAQSEQGTPLLGDRNTGNHNELEGTAPFKQSHSQQHAKPESQRQPSAEPKLELRERGQGLEPAGPQRDTPQQGEDAESLAAATLLSPTAPVGGSYRSAGPEKGAEDEQRAAAGRALDSSVPNALEPEATARQQEGLPSAGSTAAAGLAAAAEPATPEAMVRTEGHAAASALRMQEHGASKQQQEQQQQPEVTAAAAEPAVSMAQGREEYKPAARLQVLEEGQEKEESDSGSESDDDEDEVEGLPEAAAGGSLTPCSGSHHRLEPPVLPHVESLEPLVDELAELVASHTLEPVPPIAEIVPVPPPMPPPAEADYDDEEEGDDEEENDDYAGIEDLLLGSGSGGDRGVTALLGGGGSSRAPIIGDSRAPHVRGIVSRGAVKRRDTDPYNALPSRSSSSGGEFVEFSGITNPAAYVDESYSGSVAGYFEDSKDIIEGTNEVNNEGNNEVNNEGSRDEEARCGGGDGGEGGSASGMAGVRGTAEPVGGTHGAAAAGSAVPASATIPAASASGAAAAAGVKSSSSSAPAASAAVGVQAELTTPLLSSAADNEYADELDEDDGNNDDDDAADDGSDGGAGMVSVVPGARSSSSTDAGLSAYSAPALDAGRVVSGATPAEGSPRGAGDSSSPAGVAGGMACSSFSAAGATAAGMISSRGIGGMATIHPLVSPISLTPANTTTSSNGAAAAVARCAVGGRDSSAAATAAAVGYDAAAVGVGGLESDEEREAEEAMMWWEREAAAACTYVPLEAASSPPATATTPTATAAISDAGGPEAKTEAAAAAGAPGTTTAAARGQTPVKALSVLTADLAPLLPGGVENSAGGSGATKA